MISILLAENIDLPALTRLRTHPQLQVSHDMATLADAEILLIRSRTPIDRALLDRAPRLRLVITCTSGFDHIDWRACQSRGIVVTYTPDANAGSTCELTMTLLLASERQLIAARKNVRENKWRNGLQRPLGLDGRTLGIVGMGRVGRRVSKLALGFGMHLVAHDPYVEETVFSSHKAERLGFIELLRVSDYVSLHVPLTLQTRHLLNHATFKEMQAEAILINTCRGPVVDENDLMMALDEGHIAGAAMDVIEREPPPQGHRTLTHPKLLLTPHIGAFTETAWKNSSDEAVAKVLSFIQGLPLLDTLPLGAPWFEKT